MPIHPLNHHGCLFDLMEINVKTATAAHHVA